MKSHRSARLGAATLLATSLAVALAFSADARPLYFQTFTAHYGLAPGDDLYACGMCHYRWEGTGARNPFGQAVEQQLYLSKPILDAILAVEPGDADGDGYTNFDEITNWGTLPGYSCANYASATDTPGNFQSLITPLVPSCLEPKDVEIAPLSVSFVTQVGKTELAAIEVRNNGLDFPITVSSYGLLPGAPATLQVTGPPLPLVIPVGASASLTVSFAPTTSTFISSTLRISSDDPDESTIDLPVGAVSFMKFLAPAADRAACRRAVEKQAERFAKIHLREWSECFLDELSGIACDTGRRDLELSRAEAKLRSYVGGDRDRRCAGADLTPAKLDLPDACGSPCESITIGNLSDWADCLVCRQEAATEEMLRETLGAQAPDLPPAALAPPARQCSRGLARGVRIGVAATQRKLGACELANVTAGVPADCSVALGSDLSALAASVAARVSSCKDTTGMSGCLFEPGADPACLGAATTRIGADLVEEVFAVDE